MNTSFWRLGWRTLWRDLRGGDLRLLIVAVVLAVASLTAVSFFADRLKAGLQRDARQLLGGDAVLASDNPPPREFLDEARRLGLAVVQTLGFPTMARATDAQGGASRLVALKAVPEHYPLRGALQLITATEGSSQPAQGVPQPGQAWADAALADALGLRLGDTLLLGESRFRLTALIAFEPDRGAGFTSFSPRVMVNAADIAATALVQPASRVNYRLAVAGADDAVKAFVGWAKRRIDGQGAQPLRGMHIESLQSGRPEMSQTLDRAEKFLNLVALLAALLSAVAVALAARAFAASHLDDCAMLRVLGLSQRRMLAAYLVEFALAGVAASALGVLLGFAVHYLFVQLLAGLLEVALPTPSLSPVALGMGMGLTLLTAFGLPPVLQLAQVPALRVIRRDVGRLRSASAAVLALGLCGFAGLLLVASRDLTLGLIALGGFALAVLVFALLSYAAVRLLRASVSESSAPRWLRLATRQISARPAYAVVQISALAIGLLALVLLVLLRTDLIGSWRQATPPDAPNRFVINVMPEQANSFRQALTDLGVQKYDWYPMFRGRLIAVNGRAVSPQDYPDERARRLVDREFNISHSARAPEHNSIVAGRWMDDEGGAISMEEGLAKTLGLKIGDILRFDIAGVTRDSRVTSLRKVDWGSLRANFFAMYPLGRIDGVPLTYIAAFKAPKRADFDNALVRQFPNITAIDMTATLNQLQSVLDQVIHAVELLFGFALAAGLIVLFAAVTATREERAHEFAVMRALGASGSLLRQVQHAELAGIGLLAGFMASAVSMGIGWALAHFVFEFEWTVSWWLPLLGSLAGAVLALAAGWWGLREVLQRPVAQTLRRTTA
jgi:putative ABC transport system permease protein